MKKSFLMYFFSLLFAIIPIETPVGATNSTPEVKVGNATLTPETPYYDNGTAVDFCNYGSGTCSARLTVEDNVASLYLNKYNAGAISISGYDIANVIVDSDVESTIRSTDEYGIKSDADELNIYGAGYGKTLNISVNSSTDRANAIFATRGSVNLGNAFSVYMNVHSTVPANVLTTDNVTGITTPLDKTVTAKLATYLMISNKSGNYGIYTGKTIVKEGTTLNFLGEITYKLTDGVGDAFYLNDYTGTGIPADPVVDIVHAPYLTYVKQNYGTSGAFKFVARVGDVSANFDKTLTSGEDLAAASSRIKNSLVCGDGPCGMQYELDAWSSKLVIADDFETGAYHDIDSTETEVKAGEKYALKIVYQNWCWDWATFSEIKGETVANLNGENYDTFKRVSESEGYILAPLELDGEMTDYEEPVVLTLVTPFMIKDPAATAETTETEVAVIPKTPNTGRARTSQF